MDAFKNIFISVFISLLCLNTILQAYDRKNHPCCSDTGENITLAMIIDAFEIYGHDPTDKLDHLMHYQIEMVKIKKAADQYMINELVHIATDHLGRFIQLHIKEMKVLLIALDDAIDNMLTMYDNHNAIKTERVATFNSASGGAVPSEFYLSQEFYCGKNVYIFISELYSDIYNMGRGPAPYCKGRAFHFLGFMHYLEDTKYFLKEDPSIAFPMDNYIQGLECHSGVCIFRFPFKKHTQHPRDVPLLPMAVVKCGLVTYHLPPLTAASCIISSGSFILDFNIQGIRYRHHDFLLVRGGVGRLFTAPGELKFPAEGDIPILPNGVTYYTKEKQSPLRCDYDVCEWNSTNYFGGPFAIPGEPGNGQIPIPPWVESTTEPDIPTPPPMDPNNQTYSLEGCWYMFPPNYGSIAGISYLDPLSIHDYRYSCQGSGTKGLYWYPQWMGAPPHHPYPRAGGEEPGMVPSLFYPHQQPVASPPQTIPH